MKILHSPLCIAISGQSGCGNTSISSMLAEKLSIKLVNYTFRSVATEYNIPFETICAQAVNDPKWDYVVDEKQKTLSKDVSCVVGSRLAIWLLTHARIKIYLYADEETRSKNIQKREGGTFEQRLLETHNRDTYDIQRYQELYKIDILDYKDIIDIIISVKNKSKETIIEEILKKLYEVGLITY